MEVHSLRKKPDKVKEPNVDWGLKCRSVFLHARHK